MGEGLLPFSEDLVLRKKAKGARGEDTVADCSGMFHGNPVGGEKDAAERIVKSGQMSRHCEIVMTELRRNQGRTGAELCNILWLTLPLYNGYDLGMNVYEVRRRLSDLKRLGFARQGATRKCAVARKRAVTWWPVEGA